MCVLRITFRLCKYRKYISFCNTFPALRRWRPADPARAAGGRAGPDPVGCAGPRWLAPASTVEREKAVQGISFRLRGVGRPSRNPPSTARSRALRRWRPADSGACRLVEAGPDPVGCAGRPPAVGRAGRPFKESSIYGGANRAGANTGARARAFLRPQRGKKIPRV